MPNKLERLTSEVGFPIACIGITKDNEIVLGGGGGAGRSGAVFTIESHNLKSANELVLSSDEDAPTCLAIHPTERALVSSINASKEAIKKGENKNSRVFELKKKGIKAGKSTMTVCSTSDFDYQRCVGFDPTGRLFAGGSTNGTLAVIQYPQLTPAFPFIEASGEINDVGFNYSGKWLAVATNDELKIVQAKTGKLVQTIDNPHTTSGAKAVFRFARFGQGKEPLKSFPQYQQQDAKTDTGIEMKDVLYTVMNTKSRKQAYVALWDTRAWRRIATRPVCNSAITTFALSESGRLFAFATASLSIVVCDAHSLRVLLRIPAAHGFAITALAFDKEEEYLISGSADETCTVTRLPDRWPTAFDGVVEFTIANLQTIILLLVVVLAVLAALWMRR
ncbi:hypothetical protein LPJ56_000448 [Coemansia sp. RSA 2599]|nr:hypothetical protein LPJ75_000103 [Coemansia sp. RSA 2598]KAJ1829349.1 hypothetical protein LPJ56_000448 [Coemansia sp. RSA 2599]